MRLKSFYANTMKEAMKMVKDVLGEDAIIVATREENGGKAVRVTAAIDHEERDYFEGQNSRLNENEEADAWFNGYHTNDEDEEAVLERVTDALLRHAVPEEITDQILSCATVVGQQDPAEALIESIEHLFTFKPLFQKTTSTLMLVGPPGSGKTLLTAKLATRDVMDGLNVAVISTDTVRAGGIEQLASFTKILNVDLQRAKDADELSHCLERSRMADRVYIDTGGINPYDPQEMRDLARLVAAGPIEPVMVMPAGMDAAESGDIARAYGSLGIEAMISTRLDIAKRLGGLLGAAQCGSLYFAEASNKPKVAEGLFSMSPKGLARLLMPEAFKSMQRADSRTPRNQIDSQSSEPYKQKVNTG